MPATDFGFVFDIYTLDNSFNLTINGTKMATGEIQFERGSSPAQNIRFADGTAWQDGTIAAIYNMKGTEGKPLVRVVISKDGTISMFGSKTLAEHLSHYNYSMVIHLIKLPGIHRK
jgi:hypothetical protein